MHRMTHSEPNDYVTSIGYAMDTLSDFGKQLFDAQHPAVIAIADTAFADQIAADVAALAGGLCADFLMHPLVVGVHLKHLGAHAAGDLASEVT
jgi:hypothetical protein